MTTRWQASCFRFTALILFVLSTNGVLAQETSSDEGKRFVSIGQLANVPQGGGRSIQYVLLDDAGEVVCSLRAATGVSLSEFVGQEVGVTARTLVDGETPILLAENITSFGIAENVQDDVAKHIGLASYEESIAEDANILPSPVLDPKPNSEGGFGQTTYGPVLDGAAIGHPSGSSCGMDGCASCGGGCGDAACVTCAACPCGLPGDFWVRSEYLIWWTDGMDTPPLITSSPAGTSQANAGVLGQPGTQVLFGDEALYSDSRSGARFRIGKWRDRCRWVGFETDFFFLSDEDQNYVGFPLGGPIIGRPFNNVLTGNNDAELVQFPGQVIGAVQIDATTSLWSIGPRLRVNLACEKFPSCYGDPCSVGGYRLDMLVGYRYMSLEDNLRIREQLVAPSNAANPQFDDVTQFNIVDAFDTSNEFHGVDLGFLWEGYRGPWSMELAGRVGLGNTRQDVSIRGSTVRTANGTTFSNSGGILALDTNIGTYVRDEFTVLPEISATLGYALSARTRFLVGYTLLYWDKVARAGNQIDLNVNPDFIPDVQPTIGPSSPAFAFTDTNFWAQGLSLGLEYRW